VVAGSRTAQATPGATTSIFHGSAAAYGVRATYIVDGIPLTKTPFDGGGPTAQAAVDTGLSRSTGYAASPDPGQFFATGPGLAAGALGGGVPGVLPPLTGLPSPPQYPFLVASDANTNPKVAAGQDPVRVSAQSDPAASRSEATFGMADSGGAGSGAVSTASVRHTSDGAGTATATADLRGLSVGPLTLGHVLSSVTKTLKADGTVVPSTTLEVSGAQISGTPVNFTPEGFSALNSTLRGILKNSGVDVQFVAAENFPSSGRVIAPGLKISMPIPQSPQIPGLGQFSGTATYFIGFATAEIAPPDGVPTSAGTTGDASPASASTASTPTASSSTASAGLLPDTAHPVGTPAAALLTQPAASAPTPSGAVASPSSAALSGVGAAPPVPTQFQPVVAAAEFSSKGIRSVYLLAVAAVVAAIAAGLRIVRPGAAK
jgi:hypothetical protein